MAGNGKRFGVANEARFATLYPLIVAGLVKLPIILNTFYPTREVMLKREKIDPIIDIQPDHELPFHTILFVVVTPQTLMENSKGQVLQTEARSIVNDYEEYIGSLDSSRRSRVVHLDPEMITIGLDEVVDSLYESGILTAVR